MTEIQFNGPYRFLAFLDNGVDEPLYRVARVDGTGEAFCWILNFATQPPIDYTTFLGLARTYYSISHPRVAECLDIRHADQAQKSFLYVSSAPFTLNTIIARLIERKQRLSEQSIWYIAGELIEGLAYLNLPRRDIIEAKSSLLSNTCHPHCYLRPAFVLCDTKKPLDQVIDTLCAKDVEGLPFEIKLVPGVICREQLKVLLKTARVDNIIAFSPELYANGIINESTDTWGLGIVLYELSMLQKPFTDNRSHTNKRDTGTFRDELFIQPLDATLYSNELDQFVRKMLDFESRPTINDLFSNQRVQRVLRELELHRRRMDAKGGPDGMSLGTYRVMRKLKYSTASELKDIEFRCDALKRDNYMQEVALNKNGASSVPIFSKEKRFTNTHVGLDPASSHVSDQQRQAFKTFKEANKRVPSLTRLMDCALKNDVKKARKFREEVCIALLDGTTALMLAAKQNSVGMVKTLLPLEGCIRGPQGKTALMLAVQAGAKDAVELLVESEQLLVDDKGYTALMHAIEAQNLEIVGILIPYEARYATPRGISAGTLAIHDFDMLVKKSVQLHLIWPNSGSNESEEAKSVRNAIMIAQKITLEEEVVSQKTGLTCLMEVIRSKYLVLFNLFQHELRRTTQHGLAAIHIAARLGIEDAVRILAPHEALMTTPFLDTHISFCKATALCLAVMPINGKSRASSRGSTRLSSSTPLNNNVFALRYSDMSQTTIPSAQGRARTPFSSGQRRTYRLNEPTFSAAQTSIIETLLQYEGRYQEPRSGKTALITAAVVGNVVATRLLAPVQSNLVMVNGWTALMCAVCTASNLPLSCLRPYLEVVTILLPYQKNMECRFGWTALVYAAAYLCIPLLETLAPFEGSTSGRQALSFLGALVSHDGIEQDERLRLMEEGRTILSSYSSTKGLPESSPDAILSTIEQGLMDMQVFLCDKSGVWDEAQDELGSSRRQRLGSESPSYPLGPAGVISSGINLPVLSPIKHSQGP
ncbi:Kinase, NEK [Giardia muris]|uniref:Kinase, NEK n=1 Tax=Giardia muris TaxID=5742 RepID=A0A4Z1T209_GIAMU|nr:Kinase, NEK [Giardia muris]|eukprot:TNJ29698.1 Kinase, NEK [Giardia muris]